MSNFKNPSTLPELRQRLLTCIDKLSDRATLSQASNELNYLSQTITSQFLPCFLTTLLSIDSSSKSSVRVHCINLLQNLTKTHQENLISHIPKIIIPSLLRRIRDPDSSVRSACSIAIGALSTIGFSSLVGPLISSIMSEQESNAQMGSCICLRSAIEHSTFFNEGDKTELRRVLPKFVKMVKGDGFKAKPALLGLIGSLVMVDDGGLVNGKVGVLGNVVSCCVELLSCEDWKVRKEAAEVIEKVGFVVESGFAIEVKRFVVGCLESKRFDKVKITREIMNRALDVWKDLPGGPQEDWLLSRSNSSLSKDNGSNGSSPPVSRRSSFASFEAPKPKKTMTKSRSSLSDSPVTSISSSMDDVIGFETPQRKKTLSKSRSVLSEDSTLTDCSSLSKSSYDGRFEIPHSKKPTTKNRSSLPDDFTTTLTKKTTSQNRTLDQSECKLVENITTETRSKVGGIRSSSREVPFVDKTEFQGSVFETNEVGENKTDAEELSLIRNQLLQIERQQSNLMDMLQRFMGNSQNGIDSLETRVTGLERALDEISYDLAMQSGRIPHNDSPASTCCPSTEFLSPKFWRRTEGRSSMSKPSWSGSVANKDSNVEVLQMDDRWLPKQKEIIYRDEMGSFDVNSSKSVKNIGHNTQRGRTCSPRSFDGATNAPFMAPVIRGA